MDYLLDTHILLWAEFAPEKLSQEVKAILENPQNKLFVSAVNFWEISIKNALKRKSFAVDPYRLRKILREDGFEEMAIKIEHVIAVGWLDPIHKDPFDRLLIAQAIVENIPLVTHDTWVKNYQAPIVPV